MKDTPLIIIDPREIELVRYAKYHLQLRPGTNVAVLNMMAYFIVEAGLIDKDFLNQRCEEVENYLEQIKQLDIAEMERVTGVNADLVRRPAVEYASAPCAMSFHGLGVTEHSQRSKTVMLIANLAMLTGNVGRPGVGVNPLRGQNNVQGAADMGAQPHQSAGYFNVTLAEHQEMYSRAYGRPISDNIGYKIPQMFEAAHERKLKALWIMGENVVQTDPNTHAVIRAMESLELLVVQELFMTETAGYAHVVFPAASFLEKSGTFTNANAASSASTG